MFEIITNKPFVIPIVLSCTYFWIMSAAVKKQVPRPTLDLGLYGRIPYDILQKIYVDTADGGYIVVYQTKNSGSLGGWVYDAAICLAKYLESTVPREVGYCHSALAGRRVVELGAGPGIVGLFATYYGATSVLTDLESLLPLLQYNCEQNQHLEGAISARSLHWGLSAAELQPPPDYLILANCVYYQSSLEPLLETMLELTTPTTIILACYELRCPEIARLIENWHALIAPHFNVSILPPDTAQRVGGHKYGHEFVQLALISRNKTDSLKTV